MLMPKNALFCTRQLRSAECSRALRDWLDARLVAITADAAVTVSAVGEVSMTRSPMTGRRGRCRRLGRWCPLPY